MNDVRRASGAGGSVSPSTRGPLPPSIRRGVDHRVTIIVDPGRIEVIAQAQAGGVWTGVDRPGKELR